MKIKNQILMVVNPISGGIDKSKLIEAVKAEMNIRNYSLEIYKTSDDNDQAAIEKMIFKFQPERILVAGGDGTIQLVAEVLKNHDIPIGILPAGSSNGLALNLNLPVNLNEQLKVALGDTFFKMDTLQINNRTCLHIADLGINAELIRNLQTSNIRGKLGYILHSIPTLMRCEYPFEFEIEANGKQFIQKGVLLAIANARKFGTGANINPSGKLNDGYFELILFKTLNFVEIFKTLNDQIILDPEFAEIISTNNALINCKTPVSFQIDGEYVGEISKVVAAIGIKKLKIAVPSLAFF
ncbi:MAG TPA: diacylglycerol kinase family protein [Gillisia sp.]|nr:diacylglycerol kinase family protein [Gillisia sp.]